MKYLFLLMLIVSILISAVVPQNVLAPIDAEDGEYSSEEGFESRSTRGAAAGQQQVEESAFQQLFGEALWKWNPQNSNEILQLPTDELLRGKTAIAVYFSASWCGPCRQFTPQLAQFYAEMNKRGKSMEVIWVSQDKTAEDFVAYYQQMPWLALPMESIPEFMQHVAPQYKVRGIPHLVILDGDDGAVITLDGRTKVLQDKFGLEFPYRPRSVVNMLPGPLRRSLKRQIRQLKSRIVNMLMGMLQGFVPAKILQRLTQ